MKSEVPKLQPTNFLVFTDASVVGYWHFFFLATVKYLSWQKQLPYHHSLMLFFTIHSLKTFAYRGKVIKCNVTLTSYNKLVIDEKMDTSSRFIVTVRRFKGLLSSGEHYF